MAPKRIVLALKGKTARRNARAELGALRDLIVAKSTLLRYEKAVDAFFRHLDTQGLQLPDNYDGLDLLVCGRIEDMWEEGDAKAYAGDLLSGMAHFIESLRGKLPAAWRLFTAWGKAELPCRAPALSVEIVLAMCGFAIRDRNLRAASGFAGGFHGLFRTGELTGLLAGDLCLDDVRGTGVANLGLTKGGKRRGAIDHVELNDANVVRLLALTKEALEPGDRMCGLSSRHFTSDFNRYLARLHLGSVGYKVYSLRRGGATHWFRKSGSMAGTCERGRWSSAQTARIYINDGLLTLLNLGLTKEQQSAVSRGLALWHSFVAI